MSRLSRFSARRSRAYAASRDLLGNAFARRVAPVDSWVPAPPSLLRLTQPAEERRSDASPVEPGFESTADVLLVGEAIGPEK